LSARARQILGLALIATLVASVGAARAQTGQIDLEAFHEGEMDAISVVVDHAEPEIFVQSPVPGSTIAGNVVTVTGTVQDLVDFGQPGLGGSPLFGEIRYIVLDDSFVQIGSGSAPVVEGRFTLRDLVLGAGSNRIIMVVTDAAGNNGDTSVEIEVDPAAPEVALVQPLNGEALLVDTVDVDLSFSAPTTIVSVNGAADGRAFGAGVALGALTLPLALGANPVTLELDAGAGPFAFSFTFFRVDSLDPPRITSPGSGDFTNQASVSVVGTVPLGTPFVEVNGVAAGIASDRVTFTASVPLAEGSNPLTAVAFPSGAASSIQVTLDTVPPGIVQLVPASGVVTPETEISFAGIADEPVALSLSGPGGVSLRNASVPLRFGIPAFPFELGPLALLAGTNALQLTATDRAGNATVLDLEAIQRSLALTLVDPADGSTLPGLRTDLTVSASEPLVLDAVYAGGRRLPALEGLPLATGQTVLPGIPLAPGANPLRLVHHRAGGSAETLAANLVTTATAADGTTVSGQVTNVDGGAGIANALVAITVGGITQVVVTASDGSYEALVESSDIEIDATADGFGTGTFSGSGTAGGALVADLGLDGTGISALMNEVAILVPPDGTVTDWEEIGVVGTVLDPNSVVTVNGVVAEVVGNRFVARDVPLAMGSNSVEVVGNALGSPLATANVAVVRAINPEHAVTIYSPPDGARVPGNGLVVRGFASASGSVAQVSPARPVPVEDGLFTITDLPLLPGPQTLTAFSRAADGSQATDEIGIDLDSPGPALLLKADPASGNTPLQTTLTALLGVDDLDIERLDFDGDGDGTLDVVDSSAPTVEVSLASTRGYLPRVFATTPDGVELSAATIVRTHLPSTVLQEFAVGNPVDLEAGPDRRLYVLDQEAGAVSRYDRGGQLELSFGSAGVGPENLLDPTGLFVAPDGRIYVADTGNQRVQVFSSEGVYEGSIGDAGTLSSPRDVAIVGTSLFVSDSGGSLIREFSVVDGSLSSSTPVDEPRGLANGYSLGVLVASPIAGLLALDDRGLRVPTGADALHSQGALTGPVSVGLGEDEILIADSGGRQVLVLSSGLAVRQVVADLTTPPKAVAPGIRADAPSIYVADG